MIFESLRVGLFQCNCIILGCERTRSAIVIDPGDEGARITALLRQKGLTAIYAVHTHAHLDHIGGTKDVAENTGALTGLHEDDLFLRDNLARQAELFGLPTPPTPEISFFLKDGVALTFGTHRMEVLHTPGHTPGSVSFYVPEIGLVTGDTLFAGSVGRTDLWGGSHTTLIQSIRKQLLSFPEDTVVYPGHGHQTTIGKERNTNPYL